MNKVQKEYLSTIMMAAIFFLVITPWAIALGEFPLSEAPARLGLAAAMLFVLWYPVHIFCGRYFKD